MAAELYPYYAGEGGIDFASALPIHPSTNKVTVCVTGGSGRSLDISSSTSLIIARSTDSDSMRLAAQASPNGQLFFSLYPAGITEEGEPDVKHPDLFAGRFVQFAIGYLEQFNNISACKGEWYDGWDTYKPSVNFSQFKTAREEGKSKKRAALSTWSGMQFAQNGFSRLSARDVAERRHCVTAIFRRK